MLKLSRAVAFGGAVSLVAVLLSATAIASSNEGPKRDRRLFVFDGTGKVIGLYAGPAGAAAGAGSSNGAAYRIYLEPLRVSILVHPQNGELAVLGQSFTSENCEGQGFYFAASAGIVTREFDPADGSLYLAATDVLVENAEIRSRTQNFGGFCGNNSPAPSTNLVPAVPFDEDLGLDFPLRLPLSIGTRSRK